MNLWIRNQDKDILVKINNIFLEKRKNMILTAEDFEENKDSYRIISYIKNNKYFDLGTYKTKERALEVLDEIQNLLIPKVILNTYSVENKETAYSKELVIEPIINDIKVQNNVNMFYQMPEE